MLLLATGSACRQPEPPAAPRLPGRTGAPAAGAEVRSVLEARSIRVQDGDSFIARTSDGKSLTIRLSGIDAPERSQPLADRARENLQFLLEDRPLQVRVSKYDTYDRAVAQVFSLGDGAPVDVGLAQLQGGLAWFFRRYRNDLPAESQDSYARAEQAARTARRGMWQSGEAEPPWEFRQRRQPHNRSASP